jgi:protein N-terminal methyltransferase
MSTNPFSALDMSPSPTAAPASAPVPSDSQINHAAALEYWSSIPATVNGVLGGYPQVSRADLAGNRTFLAKLRRRGKGSNAPISKKVGRAVDCGAGIGRVTKGFLVDVAEVVDVVEPVAKLAGVVSEGEEFQALREQGSIGDVYVQGLQEWTPKSGTKYDLVWVQWCCGQVTDAQFVEFLGRMQPFVNDGGWIVVKENMSTDTEGNDIFDETDSSVTRADAKFRSLFGQAHLEIVATEVQKGLPKELYPVRSYALQPKKKG